MLSWTGPAFAAPLKTGSVAVSADRAALSISSPFGWRSDPIKGVRRRHAGVDLPGPSGTRIFATGPGIVSFAGWSRGYGNMVQVDHADGVRTRFGHLSNIAVSAGTSVRQGALLGWMGSTGRSTGVHLHYEVRVNGRPVDPLAYMGQTAHSEETLWAPQAKVSGRWTGWGQAERERLPMAQIR